ncbi:hypothetical protein AcW1_007326 [Taiwanofungus camphoratus]|nr:hypothetical protein AcW2_007603 [Antrodia cinnamomea]KAI0920023.1 hypothetical protein AcV7_006034 [Antrodia cinnamomea]KAI0927425.1 hypothetical protein AcV5_007968 [Antrodia cinnamomea]KAI0952993.1 hypothetical protein AcW1_007326 [Antrodia cinnamomea]
MSMPRKAPLISIPLPSPPRPPYVDDGDDDNDTRATQKRWYHYLPLSLAVILILAPQPSLLIILIKYHLRILQSPSRFLLHLIVTYTLLFLALSSLIAVVARDPGPVVADETQDTTACEREDMSLMQALLAPDEDGPQLPGKWCRKCNAPKPERAHHCSSCGRCVLKMDHHCVWLGQKCIGHRNYSAFVHFLTCISALALYVASLCVSAVYFAFTNPMSIDEYTPLHELFLAFYCIAMALVIGSFWLYHVYLVTTNQTTLEHLSPFLLLRHIPPLSPLWQSAGRPRLSNPPLEHELSYSQRRLVRNAHRHIHLYDIGWRNNWAQVMGWNRPWGWAYRLACGGGGMGDGRAFPRNPRADDMLARLSAELVDMDKDQ